jgi:hypothetical protein
MLYPHEPVGKLVRVMCETLSESKDSLHPPESAELNNKIRTSQDIIHSHLQSHFYDATRHTNAMNVRLTPSGSTHSIEESR